MSDIQHLKEQCNDASPSSRDLQKLVSLAFAARELCEWTRHNEYPQKMSAEFVRLTELIDQLDTEVRRVFPSRT